MTTTELSTEPMPLRWRERTGAIVHPTGTALRPHGLLARSGVGATPAAKAVAGDEALVDLSIDEWDILFRAVSQKLAASVTGSEALTAVPETLRDVMRSGVEALDQLHAMLVLERARHQKKIELFDAQRALAEALTGYVRSTGEAPVFAARQWPVPAAPAGSPFVDAAASTTF
jgi:hypothetical protein